MKKILFVLFIPLMLWLSCEEDLPKDCAGVPGGDAVEDDCGVCDDNSSNDCVEDCAGIWGGDNICGCTDSTAVNYNNTATFDDGSCERYTDNGEFFLSFDGVDDFVDLGDMLSQGAYTKVAWVKENPRITVIIISFQEILDMRFGFPPVMGISWPQGMMVRGPQFKIMNPCQLGNGTL